MFSLYNYKLCDLPPKLIQIVISRNVRSQFRNKYMNKGIQNRLRILKEETPEYQKLNINEESIENMESDFMNSKDVFQFHKRELDKMNNLINYKIIERKYFEKKNLPNMLTWSEKEQIRQLHQSDPEMWTVEKLSQSFPSSPNIVKKILKSQWKISPLKLKKHDSAVARNWELLKEGKLNVDKNFAEYLQSFSSRDKSMVHCLQSSIDNEINKNIIQDTAVGEFSEIIKSHRDVIKNNDGPKEESPFQLNSGKKRHFRNDKSYTLEELRQEVKNSCDKPFTPLSSSDEAFLKSETKDNPLTLYTENIEISQSGSLKTKYTVQEIEVDPVLQGAGYSVKIKIPERKRRRGALYKMKDCYYDDKGDFLYRVPGMES